MANLIFSRPRYTSGPVHLVFGTTALAPSATFRARVGDAWVPGVLKAHVAGAWVTKPLKTYSGAAWVTLTMT